MKTPDFKKPLPDSPELQDFMVMYAVYQFNRFDRCLITTPFDRLKISARIAYYLQVFLWIHHINDYFVDLDYYRLYKGVDITAKKTRRRPFMPLDILVHKRVNEGAGEKPLNVMCIEIKNIGIEKGSKAEEHRLEKMTDPKWDYHFRTGYILCGEFKGEHRRTLHIKRVFRGGELVPLIESPF